MDIDKSHVRTVTALSWITGIGTIAAVVAWGWLTSRVENLETGRSTPMAETTRLEIQRLDRDVARIETELHGVKRKIEALEHGERGGQAVCGERGQRC